jgi:hypothetical protein
MKMLFASSILCNYFTFAALIKSSDGQNRSKVTIITVSFFKNS